MLGISFASLCIFVVIVAAVLFILHAAAVNIRDGHELHDLTVRVHTLRNDYLTRLRGEMGFDMVEVEEGDGVETAGSIGPDQSVSAQSDATEQARAA